MRLALSLASLGATLLLGATASAQSAPDPCANLPTLPEGQAGGAAGSAPAAVPAAQLSQQYLRCALAQFGRQDYRRAIHFFGLANRAAPSADLLYNIARSHELMNEYDEAATAYEHYLRDKVNAPDRADVEQRIRQLRDLARRRRDAARQRDGRALLTVRVDQPGAAVSVDDRSVGTSPLAPGLQVTPGAHQIRVEREGYQLWQGTVRARQGETGRAEVTLTEATRYRTQPAPHIASFVLGGVGAASIVGGVVLALVAPPACTVDPMTRTCAVPMIPSVTAASCEQTGTCGRDGMLLGSSLAIGGGVALLTGAAIEWFVEAGAGRTERVRIEQRRASR